MHSNVTMCLITSIYSITKIDKSMAYIINESGGDFQKDGCLSKPISGIQWIPELSRLSDRPQKQSLEKAGQLSFGSGAVVIS